MPTAIDLFCGCGGLSLGFQNAGFTILRAFDIWDKAINNYNLNFSHPAELQDINQLSPDYLKSFSPDVIIGGPPCQDYSSAGRQDETLGRANLTLRYAEFVCSVRSRWFVMENVDRILKSSTLPKALALFRNAGYGLSQVVNYSFMDKNDLKKLNFPEDSSVYNAISIMNPISDEYPEMRTSLMTELMHTLQYNLSKKNDQVAIFEYGHIYEPKRFPLDELPKEYSLISGLMCGGPAENGYPNDQREYDFFDIKAVMENVLSALSIRDYKIRRTNYPVFHPGVSAEFVKNDVILARFGELHPAVLDKWNIKRIVYGFTISLPDIMIFAGAATI